MAIVCGVKDKCHVSYRPYIRYPTNYRTNVNPQSSELQKRRDVDEDSQSRYEGKERHKLKTIKISSAWRGHDTRKGKGSVNRAASNKE